MARHLRSVGDALAPRIAVDDILVTMQQLSSRGEVMHVGGCAHYRVDQAGVLVDADIDFPPVVPLVALLGLVHLWITLPLVVRGGAGHREQGGINDRSLTHRHAPVTQLGVDGLKDLLAQPVLLQQVAEAEDPGLIRAQVTDQPDAGKALQGRHLAQGLPRHHQLNLREKLLSFGLLLGVGELVIREAELLATHHPSPGQ